MNYYRLLTILLFFFCAVCSAQKIQYSKSLLKTPGTGNIQLVANVQGFHHLIYFSYTKKPVIHVFNNQLQLHSSNELNINLPENCDIRLLQLSDYYILYAHSEQPTRHQFIKINGDGTSSDISKLINNPTDSLWNKSKATFQLFNRNNNIYLVSHSYHPQIKRIKSVVVKLDTEGPAQLTSQLIFPFDIGTDELKQVTLNDDHLLILKNTKDEDETNTLTLLKIDLASGTIISKEFESGKHVYSSPTLRYSRTDSSIFVYSMLHSPAGYKRSRPVIFMARLNHLLNEIAPLRTITNPFKDNAVSSFYVEKNKTTGWLSFSAFQGTGAARMNLYNQRTDMGGPGNSSSNVWNPDNFYYPSTQLNYPTAVRMVLLNNRLERVKDSLVKNEGRYYKIHPWTHAQFVLQSTSYLLLVHELAAKRKGLVLVYPNKDGQIETLPVRVYNQFHFMLPLLQTADDNYFIVPFTDKKEIGLMKVTFNN
ncbi:hypothetical protein [Lacibacter sp. H407]|uniref:hypothetical protein n=1 Tax=Lacibacter sp. H407 TaxID=3133423 RepID=UPI0030BCDA8A